MITALIALQRSSDATDEAKKTARVAAHTAREAKQAARQAERASRRAEQAIKETRREGRQRRDQQCRGLELQYRQEIRDLGRTYQFFESPPPEFAGLLDDPLVLQNLAEDERDAQKDRDRFGAFVPAFCDQPGAGLPEPDPEIPERPPELG